MKIPFLLFAIIVLGVAEVSAQTIEDRILRKAKQRADRKIDRTIDKGLDKVETGVDQSVKGNDKETSTTSGQKEKNKTKKQETKTADPAPVANESKSFTAYTKFDFVPGETVLFVDDFSSDNVGDFPSRWNTNGSGEVVSITESKWFELKPSSLYIPTITKSLPDDYTIEFDVTSSGINNKVSSTANLHLLFDDNILFKNGKNFVSIKIPLTQYVDVGVAIANRVNNAEVIRNNLKVDIRKKVIAGMHISIAVNKKRFRLWADDKKIIDMPTLVPTGQVQTIKFKLEGFTNDFEIARVFMGNVKIAAGGVDLRSKLISEGKLSTTAITFDVNSDKLKPESMGMIKEIAGILKANPAVKIKIIGHTDSDGDDAHNMNLSMSRANAVKAALVNSFDIPAVSIETDGKGETKPLAPNDSAEGKAANRRVDFIKL